LKLNNLEAIQPYKFFGKAIKIKPEDPMTDNETSI
jgi:hypothetical protein